MRDWGIWARAAGMRALRTFFQSLAALLPAAVTITEVDWKVVLGTAALAALASLATSLAGLPEQEWEEIKAGK